jgi:hypothetical protein
MEDLSILAAVLHLGTLVLGLTVYIITFFIRRTVETAWPHLKKQADANDPGKTYLTSGARWWNEVALYGIPVAVGCLLSLSRSEFLFGPVVGPLPQFLFSGAVAWFSSYLYKGIKRLVRARLGETTERSSSRPPPSIGGL